MSIFRFIFRFIGLIIAAFLILPIVLILIRYSQTTEKRDFNSKVLNTWSIIICYVCGMKVIVKGVKHKGPTLIVANHISWLDIAVIHRCKLVGFVAKNEISKWPLLSTVAKCGESIFIARGKHESRREVLDAMDLRFKQGKSIAIFPEGGAKNGDILGRFHRQLMHAAVETQTPIQAIAIKYIKTNGSRNKEIGFQGKERFVGNVLRILTLPTSFVEATMCEPVDTMNKTAREAALITHDQVAQVLAENDYM